MKIILYTILSVMLFVACDNVSDDVKKSEEPACKECFKRTIRMVSLGDTVSDTTESLGKYCGDDWKDVPGITKSSGNGALIYHYVRTCK